MLEVRLWAPVTEAIMPTLAMATLLLLRRLDSQPEEGAEGDLSTLVRDVMMMKMERDVLEKLAPSRIPSHPRILAAVSQPWKYKR